MAQHDHSIANDTGANVRADINNALSAIVSQNSGASAPTTTFALMWWFDTTNNLLKQRDESDANWVTLGSLVGTTWKPYHGGTEMALFESADETKLDGIAAGAEVNPDVVPQAEAEAGTATTERIWTAERVKQAIDALGAGTVGLVPLASVDLSGGTTTNPEFTSNIDGTYDVYKIFLEGIQPATDNQVLECQFYIGGVLQTGVSDYGWSWYGAENTSAISGQNGTDDRIEMTRNIAGGAVGNDAAFSLNAEITIYHPANTALNPRMTWTLFYRNANNDFTRIFMTQAEYNSVGTAMDGIRFKWNGGGNFADGSAKLYGVKNP